MGWEWGGVVVGKDTPKSPSPGAYIYTAVSVIQPMSRLSYF